MIALIVYVVLFTIVWRFLRSKIIQYKTAFPNDFKPDYGKANEKFGKIREERRKKWEKKREEEEKKIGQESILDMFDKEMEYIKFKKEYERENPLRQRSTYEGAFDLYEIKKAQRKRKIFLAKKKKEIFEKHDKMKETKTDVGDNKNQNPGQEQEQHTEESGTPDSKKDN